MNLKGECEHGISVTHFCRECDARTQPACEVEDLRASLAAVTAKLAIETRLRVEAENDAHNAEADRGIALAKLAIAVKALEVYARTSVIGAHEHAVKTLAAIAAVKPT